MSRLETAAKTLLTELILGRRCWLDEGAQTAVSAWVMMTSISAEYTDVPTQCIPAADRQYLMEKGKPNSGWKVWLGRYRGDDWKQRYGHWGTKLAQVTPAGMEPGAFQTSVFVVGECLLFAASSTDKELLEGFRPTEAETMVLIWPSSPGPIDSHQLGIHDDLQTEAIVSCVLKYLLEVTQL